MSDPWKTLLNDLLLDVPEEQGAQDQQRLQRLSLRPSASGAYHVIAPDELSALLVERQYLTRLQRLAPRHGLSLEAEILVVGERASASQAQMSLFSADTHLARAARHEVRATEAALQASTAPQLNTRVLECGLQPRLAFSSFVRGTSNEFAFEAAKAVSDHPGTHYNPLFIYGGVGLGKTHLMNAIGLEALRRDPSVRVRYLSAETFVNDLIEAIRSGSMDRFRQRNRIDVDLLLIDDVQFIAGKERTQEEFFHTFNALHQAGRQIVLTSDRIPQDMPELEERLRSRLQMGLLADIQPPDLETRIAILQKLAEQRNFRVAPDVLDYIARQVRSNVRELNGALTRIGTYAHMKRVPISVDMAREQLGQVLQDPNGKPSLEAILRATAELFHVKAADLKGRRRTANISLPRKVAMYLGKELNGASLPELGRFFGGRDHTTVLSAVRSIHDELRADIELADKVKLLQLRLR